MIQVRTIDEIFLTRMRSLRKVKNATSSLGKKHPLGTISLFDGLTNPESLRRTDVTGEKDYPVLRGPLCALPSFPRRRGGRFLDRRPPSDRPTPPRTRAHLATRDDIGALASRPRRPSARVGVPRERTPPPVLAPDDALFARGASARRHRRDVGARTRLRLVLP